MNKKNLIKICLCFLILFGLTGCINKEKITKEVFNSVTESYNLNVIDRTEEYNDDILISYVYSSNDEYFIEYYELNNEENAIKLYDQNVYEMENSKGANYSESFLNGNNCQSYAVTANGKYTYISRVENTIVFSEVKKEYKDKIKEIVKDLGY